MPSVRFDEQPGNRFDKAAPTWDDNPVRQEMAKAVYSGIMKLFSRGTVPGEADSSLQSGKEPGPIGPGYKVLDYGAGTGLITMQFAGSGAEILAVDTSAAMLSVLKRKVEHAGITNVATMVVDPDAGFDLPGRYDLVICVMVLHHVPDLSGAVSGLAGLVAPGGTLVLVDLMPEDGHFHSEPGSAVHNGIEPAILTNHITQAGLHAEKPLIVHTVERKSLDGKSVAYPLFLVSGTQSI